MAQQEGGWCRAAVVTVGPKGVGEEREQGAQRGTSERGRGMPDRRGTGCDRRRGGSDRAEALETGVPEKVAELRARDPELVTRLP